MKQCTTIRVDKDIINQFTILSAKTNRKRHELINEALELYLKNNAAFKTIKD